MTQHYFSRMEVELLKIAMIVTKAGIIAQNTPKQNFTHFQLYN